MLARGAFSIAKESLLSTSIFKGFARSLISPPPDSCRSRPVIVGEVTIVSEAFPFDETEVETGDDEEVGGRMIAGFWTGKGITKGMEMVGMEVEAKGGFEGATAEEEEEEEGPEEVPKEIGRETEFSREAGEVDFRAGRAEAGRGWDEDKVGRGLVGMGTFGTVVKEDEIDGNEITGIDPIDMGVAISANFTILFPFAFAFASSSSSSFFLFLTSGRSLPYVCVFFFFFRFCCSEDEDGRG